MKHIMMGILSSMSVLFSIIALVLVIEGSYLWMFVFFFAINCGFMVFCLDGFDRLLEILEKLTRKF